MHLVGVLLKMAGYWISLYLLAKGMFDDAVLGDIYCVSRSGQDIRESNVLRKEGDQSTSEWMPRVP